MNGRLLIALVPALCGCHPDVLRAAAPVPHHGYVREPSGSPSGAGILITVTDAASGRKVSVQRTDAGGAFAFAVPPGHYALAATSKDGFAFIESTPSDSDPVVTLSSDCHHLRVKIAGTLGFPAAIEMSRVSRHVGDRFLADIDSRGQVAACLPDGAYSAHAEGVITSLAVPITMFADVTIEVPAYSTSLVQQVPVGVRVERTDLGSFSRSLLERRVIGLGEANHGTGEFFTYRGRLSLELARSGNLRNILLEADAIGMMAIDDYVMGANVDITKAVSALRFWITDVHEFLTFLDDVRSYNAGTAPPERVHVLGIDAQRLGPPVQYMLARRAMLKISEREAALLAQIVPDHGNAFTGLTYQDQTILSSLLDRLGTPTGPADLSQDSTRASIAARSIRYQLGYLSKLGVDGLRDQAMAELTAYIVDLSNSRQTALWAHDDHIAREPTGAAKSLGQYLSDRFGEAYYPIAFLSYTGAARAWDASGEIGVIPHELGSAPSYNLESVIISAAKSTDAAWVSLDTATGALRQWLNTPRYVREFGAAYSPGDTQKLRSFPSAISGVVVIQHATASTPTPTGVRKVSR